ASEDGASLSFGERRFLSESVEGYSLPPNGRVQMTFREPLRFNTSVSCNTISSDYRMANGIFAPGPLSRTEGSCGGEYEDPDDWLYAFLEASPSFSWDDPRLTLFDSSSRI